jgi:hypothetical protein
VGAAGGIVPCGLNGDAAATCNICTFGSLIQNIINFAIGLSIPLAAVLFAYAGWLYFSNRENSSKIEQAHRIFTSVLIGFASAVAGWLIVQTILKTLAPGYQSWTTFNCTANRPMSGTIGDLLQQSGVGGVSVVPTPLSGSTFGTACPDGSAPSVTENGNVCIGANGAVTPAQSTANCDPTLGCFNNTATSGDIAAAAAAYYNTDTSAGPDGGNKACAWAVNNILQNDGIAPLGDGVSVASMWDALQYGGRGTPVDQSSAQAGDIVVWKTDTVSHVGICYSADCSQVISNSSSRATFSNFSGTTLLGVQGRIYRVNN